jgi:hypothetical protein
MSTRPHDVTSQKKVTLNNTIVFHEICTILQLVQTFIFVLPNLRIIFDGAEIYFYITTLEVWLRQNSMTFSRDDSSGDGSPTLHKQTLSVFSGCAGGLVEQN